VGLKKNEWVSTREGREVPDDARGFRTIMREYCLIKGTIAVSKRSSSVSLLFSDSENVHLQRSEDVKFVFNSSITDPATKVWIEGYGTRHGHLLGGEQWAEITFRDQAQFDEFITTVHGGEERTVEVHHQRRDGGEGLMMEN
jgi:hypothetical protein